MNNGYIPTHFPPGEDYWTALLEEGPLSHGASPGPWEWEVRPETSTDIWEKARQMQRERCPLPLKIEGFNRGGLIAQWEGVECFIPASHLVAYPFPADPVAREQCLQEYVGREMRLCVTEVEPARQRLLFSERQVPDCTAQRQSWPDWLCSGATCEGEVTSVLPFGAFVNIGPLEGMIHISEISWGRVRHPGDFLKPGQQVKVMILNVDPDRQHVGLSLKRLTPNPWDSVEEHLSPGDKVTGTVVSVARFGVFVELVNGLEGLLHVSELSGNSSPQPPALHHDYHRGQTLEVQVLEIAPRKHRISLGLPDKDAAHVQK